VVAQLVKKSEAKIFTTFTAATLSSLSSNTRVQPKPYILLTNNFAFRNYTEIFNSPTQKETHVYVLWVTPKLLTLPPRYTLLKTKCFYESPNRNYLSRRIFHATSRPCCANYLKRKPVHDNCNKPLPIVRHFQAT
jgi:hypothetical protein